MRILNKFAVFFMGRLLLAFFSSSVLALLAQLAVFRYTRFEEAPIPAGAIIGPSAGTFSIVIGSLWFAVITALMLIGGSKFLFSLILTKPTIRNSDLLEYFLSIRSYAKWGMIPTVVAIAIALIAIFSPSLTERTLKFLGYGGGMWVCYIDSDSVDSSVSKWIGESFSEDGEGLISSERDASRIKLTGVVRGRLIYSSNAVAYIKLVTTSFGDIGSTEMQQTVQTITDLMEGGVEAKIKVDGTELSSDEVISQVQQKELVKMLAVDFGEFLLSGYHQVPMSRISAGCGLGTNNWFK